MARYFFRLHDHIDADADGDCSRELPDMETAIAAATDEIRDLLADQVRHGYLDLGLSIEITDASGRKVASVHFNEAVKLRD
jgi:hypothetical protein